MNLSVGTRQTGPVTGARAQRTHGILTEQFDTYGRSTGIMRVMIDMVGIERIEKMECYGQKFVAGVPPRSIVGDYTARNAPK